MCKLHKTETKDQDLELEGDGLNLEFVMHFYLGYLTLLYDAILKDKKIIETQDFTLFTPSKVNQYRISIKKPKCCRPKFTFRQPIVYFTNIL